MKRESKNFSFLTGESQNKEIAEQREEQILKAALEVFTMRGYDAATIQKIAGVAGVSVGTIYNHFADKSELFIAVIGKIFITDRIYDIIDNMPEAGLAFSFQQIIEDWFEVGGTIGGSRIHHLMNDVMSHPELRALFLERLYHPLCAKMEATCKDMMDSGKLRDMYAPIATRAMLGVFYGFSSLNCIEGDKCPITFIRQEEIAHALANLVSQGLSLDTAK